MYIGYCTTLYTYLPLSNRISERLHIGCTIGRKPPLQLYIFSKHKHHSFSYLYFWFFLCNKLSNTIERYVSKCKDPPHHFRLVVARPQNNERNGRESWATGPVEPYIQPSTTRPSFCRNKDYEETLSNLHLPSGICGQRLKPSFCTHVVSKSGVSGQMLH